MPENELLRRRTEGGTDPCDHFMRSLRDLLPIETVNVPPAAFKAVVARLVGSPIEQRAVVETAIRFDEYVRLPIDELDPSDPAIGVAEVNLSGGFGQPGLAE